MKFDHWTADAAIGDNGVTLKENHLQQGARKGSVTASIAFGDPPTVSFVPANGAALKK